MGAVAFAGRPVFVTGASRGIGRSIALELARQGCPVFAVARGLDDLATLRDEVARRHPGLPCEVFAADVSDATAMERAAAAMVDGIGPPAGVVCAAGFARPGYFEEIPVDVVRRLMEVNYLGSVFAVRATLPHLPADGFVSVTSSVLGWIGAFGTAPYTASKFALVGFAESLRQELAPRGIHVSVLCPPDTDTPGFAQENETKPVETAELSKSGGLVSPDLVAQRYLAGLRRGRFLIHVTLTTGAGYRLKGWAPELVRSAMDWMVTRAQRRIQRGELA